MAKPRIFLSSTCYDLSIVRSELTEFLSSRGFEVINSEKHSFGVTPGMHSHSACIDAVDNADYVLLLIGKRRGGTYIGSESSITNEEYERAVSKGIPCIVCVLREVDDYRITYKKNPSGNHSHIVDDKRIFHFIDYIASGHTDNWIHRFETVEDLRSILTTQFSHYLFLFSQSVRPKKNDKKEEALPVTSFPANLDLLKEEKLGQDEETALRNGLRTLHEILSNIATASIKPDAKAEKLKCLWVFARYGEISMSERAEMKMDLFKQYAWSYSRGKRVFNQFEPFGVSGEFDEDGTISIGFVAEDEDNHVLLALFDFIGTLLKQHEEKEAYRLFCAVDMRCYMKI